MSLSVLVVGAGSIGTRHLCNLRSLGISRLAVCEPDVSRREAAARSGVTVFCDLGEAIESFKPSAGLVCTPPIFHVSVAQALLNAGADVFVEKPLAASLDGVDELIASSQRTKRILQVGYNLRFHPVLTLVKRLLEDKAIGPVLYAHARVGQYLPDWRPQVDYRQSYTARRDLGGGILLDASHELDYVLWLLGNPVSVACVAGKASSLDVDVEDSATVLLGYARGAHAVVHMDFVRRGYARTLELVGETGNLVADLGQRSLRLERSRDEARDIEVPEGDMYVAELGHFLECVATRMPPLVDAAAGRQTLRLVMLAKIAARDGSTHQVG